jgi:hypothetical protein
LASALVTTVSVRFFPRLLSVQYMSNEQSAPVTTPSHRSQGGNGIAAH